jgi:hypothetical protein
MFCHLFYCECRPNNKVFVTKKKGRRERNIAGWEWSKTRPAVWHVTSLGVHGKDRLIDLSKLRGYFTYHQVFNLLEPTGNYTYHKA